MESGLFGGALALALVQGTFNRAAGGQAGRRVALRRPKGGGMNRGKAQLPAMGGRTLGPKRRSSRSRFLGRRTRSPGKSG